MILVTGGTGFLGGYIVNELLDAGENVRVLARNPSNSKFPAKQGLEIVEGDILDVMSLEKAMEHVDYVIHAAAMVSFWKRNAVEMKAINVKGTANVVDLSRELGIKKLVHVSSVAALGRIKSMDTIDETAKWKDNKLNTRYGKTKYLAELEVLRGVEEGLNAVMCNPGLILGRPIYSAWKTGTARMFARIYQGLSWYPGGYSGLVSVKDVAKAIHLLLKSKFISGERFVLVGDNRGYKEIFEVIAKGLNVKAPSRKAPALVARWMGKLSETLANIRNKEPLITRETTRTSSFRFHYDGSLITRETEFRYTALDDTIRETAEAFLKENGNNT